MAAVSMRLTSKGRNYTRGLINRKWVKKQVSRLARRMHRSLMRRLVDPPARVKVGKG